ncbi:MAG: stage III sporulation protein AG [Clostridia bacterium]|nr:stage III sporulation protein AG [Clostridia bacterium]
MKHLEDIRKALRRGRLGELLFSPECSGQRMKLLLAVGFAAIGLLFLSDTMGGGTKSTSAEPAAYARAETDYEEYADHLERRLTGLISSVDGAGSVKVMVTLECGTEYVYAVRQKSTSAVTESAQPDGRTSRDEKRSGEESLVLVNAGRGEEPLLLKQYTPTVAGVVVLCSGADDVNVRQQIIDVVTTALRTSSNRVCVTKLA